MIPVCSVYKQDLCCSLLVILFDVSCISVYRLVSCRSRLRVVRRWELPRPRFRCLVPLVQQHRTESGSVTAGILACDTMLTVLNL